MRKKQNSAKSRILSTGNLTLAQRTGKEVCSETAYLALEHNIPGDPKWKNLNGIFSGRFPANLIRADTG
jgi:hypothetical protein